MSFIRHFFRKKSGKTMPSGGINVNTMAACLYLVQELISGQQVIPITLGFALASSIIECPNTSWYFGGCGVGPESP